MVFTPKYELNDIKVAAQIVANLLKELENFTIPGRNVLDCEKLAEEFIKEHGATPYNKGYKPDWAPTPFPSVLCVNINDEAVHCPARDYVIKEGDVVNFDVGVRFKTACGDAATTVYLGNDPKKKQLLSVTKLCLERATQLIKPGINTNTLSKEIETTAKAFGFTPIQGVGGHRIGEEMHLPPFIGNKRGESSYFLEEGMVVCLEPVLTSGNGKTIKLDDGWTVKSKNGEDVAQFEDMVLITKEGYEILTDL